MPANIFNPSFSPVRLGTDPVIRLVGGLDKMALAWGGGGAGVAGSSWKLVERGGHVGTNPMTGQRKSSPARPAQKSL